jgi:choline kinase
MRCIILAAGESIFLDGMIKSLLINPLTGLSFLKQACTAFASCEITVVVGHRAIEIMQAFPELNYVYNSDWAVTNNAYSLGLALDERPCIVISADLLLSNKLIDQIMTAPLNSILVSKKENRIPTEINCVVNNSTLIETYMGPLRSSEDPASIGVFKLSSCNLLRLWKNRCLQHGNLFAGQTLPLGSKLEPIFALPLVAEAVVHEVNTVLDYMRLLDLAKEKTHGS